MFMDHNQLDQFLRKSSNGVAEPTLIKTHGVAPLALQWLTEGKLRAICTYRDPRDCVASDLTFLGWDFKTIVRRVLQSFEFLDHYQGLSSIYFIRYEDMMRDTLGQIRGIADHLGIRTTDATLRRIDGETNIQSSLKICQTLKHRSADQVLHVAEHRVDPDTQLHDNHIHNSRTGRWRDELSVNQAAELNSVFRPWLLKFGYVQPEVYTGSLYTGSVYIGPAYTGPIDTLAHHDNVARQERLDGKDNAARSTPAGHHSWNAPVGHVDGVGAA